MNFKPAGLFFLIFIQMISACSTIQKSVKNNTAIKAEACFKAEAFKRYVNDTAFLYNTDSSYVLCSRKRALNNPNPNELSEFFVADCVTCTVVYTDKISGAAISWYNIDNLLIIKQKGFIENKNDRGKSSYIVNIKTHSQKEIYNDRHTK